MTNPTDGSNPEIVEFEYKELTDDSLLVKQIRQVLKADVRPGTRPR